MLTCMHHVPSQCVRFFSTRICNDKKRGCVPRLSLLLYYMPFDGNILFIDKINLLEAQKIFLYFYFVFNVYKMIIAWIKYYKKYIF